METHRSTFQAFADTMRDIRSSGDLDMYHRSISRGPTCGSFSRTSQFRSHSVGATRVNHGRLAV